MAKAKVYTRDEAIQAARQHVEQLDGGSDGRRWLVGGAVLPYNYFPEDDAAEYRTSYGAHVQMLEGTPPHGYVVALGFGMGGSGVVLALGMYGGPVKKFNYQNQ